ncbi:hypothetical protein O3P69_018016 [Scylla paramamosain]|uniref:Phytanoyl-CoA dioxygenase family protein n=1 Tax=Scylla paramamosain TaxID=85552 RepID=A0AAW0TIW6_SCYPA
MEVLVNSCLPITDSVFTYTPGCWQVTEAMKQAYKNNGYILVRNILTKEEVTKVRVAVESSEGIQAHAQGKADGEKTKSKMALWNHPGNDVSGMLARMERVAGTMEQLMGGDEVYHYHSKLMMKDAYTGGRHVWHQDYGYWYNNGCLYPEMASVFLPVDDCDRGNSCLQVIHGSHRLGRVDHYRAGDQMRADDERVQETLKILPHLYVEMKAGDALFFHCNLLHTSDPNTSSRRRWVFIVAFNKRSNDPYKDHHHPRYTPLVKVPDSALMACNVNETLEGKWFMQIGEDKSVMDKAKTH